MRRYFGKRLFTTVLCAVMIFDSSAISVLAEEIDDSRLIVENVEINEDIEINDDIELGIEAYDETLLIDDDNSEEIVLDNDNKDSNDEKDTVISAGDADSMSEDSPIETWNIGAGTATDVQAKLYEISDRKYRLEITGSGTMLDFSTSAPWKDYYICELSIEEGIENIGACAFRSCSGLTSITIPESVKIIGENAFMQCEGITFIDIPDSVTTIYEGAFSECSQLSLITGGENVTNLLLSSGGRINYGIFEASNSPLTGLNEKASETLKNYNWAADHRTMTLAKGGGTKDNFVYIINTDDTITILGYQGTPSGDLVIPNEIEGYPVTSIGKSVFYNINDITGVVIPDSVITIGDGAFCDCRNLKELVISNSVTTIGERAFCGCRSLKELVIPKSVTNINYGAFLDCRCLENIEVVSGNTIYDSRNNCKAIIETENNTLIVGCNNSTIPEGVIDIGVNAFEGCTGLTSIIIPDSVTKIEQCAFSECSALTGITIPKNVTDISVNVFSKCSEISSIAVDANNPKYDSRNNCNAIIETDTDTLIAGCKNSTIPGSVEVIGRAAFYGCKSLSGVTISNGVKTIEDDAFMECSELTSIMFPEGLTTIGSGAFNKCDKLTKIYGGKSVVNISNWSFWLNNSSKDKLDTYLDNDASDALKNYNWAGNGREIHIEDIDPGDDFVYEIDDGEVTIRGYKGVASKYLIIPDIIEELPVNYIAANAFENSTSLECVILPSSLTGIGSDVFEGCTNLKVIDNKSDISIILNNVVDTDTYKWYSQDKEEIVAGTDGNKWLPAKSAAYREDWFPPEPESNPEKPDVPDVPEFKAHSFTKDDVSVKFTKAANASMEYTGNYLMPTVSVTYTAEGSNKAVTLKENVDYKLSYMNNKNVGTAKVRAYGIGDFCDSKDISFVITARDIANKKAKVTIGALPEIVFTNEAEVLNKVSAALNVTYNGKELVEGNDYIVEKVDTIENPAKEKGVNVNAKITGKNNYTGSKEFKFKLVPNSVKKTDISTGFEVTIKNDKISAVYTGKLIKPQVVVTNKSTNKKLKTSDYKVSYYNNLNVGKATIKVFGTKGYTGSLESTFEITKKDINKCKITVKNSTLLYTGFDQKKNVSLTVKDGSNILKEGVDYVVEYSGDWKGITGKTGKPTVQIKAAAGGNYMNNDAAKKKLMKTFKISKAKLNSSVSVTATLMLNGTELKKGTGKDASKYVIPKDNYEAFKNGNDNIVVKYNGMKLNGIVSTKGVNTTGKEYTIKIKEIKKNKAVTGGTITLTGVNSFTGKRTIKFIVK